MPDRPVADDQFGPADQSDESDQYVDENGHGSTVVDPSAGRAPGLPPHFVQAHRRAVAQIPLSRYRKAAIASRMTGVTGR